MSLDNGNVLTGTVYFRNSGANIVCFTDVNTLTLGTLAIGQNLNVTSTGALNLGTGSIGGTLTANSNGGAIIETAGGLNVTSTSSITAGAAAITLTDGGNDFVGAVSLNNSGANNVAVNNGANALTLGTVSVGSGTLNLSGVGISEGASGTITQASGAGLVTLAAGAGAIALANGNDFTGTVNISNSGANDVTINDINTLTLGTLAIGQNLNVTSTGALNLGTGSIGGTLTANSNGGAISETAGGLSVTGTSSITAGAAAITLTDGGNDFVGAVSLSNSGAHNVALSNGANALTLNTVSVGSGTLNLSGVGISEGATGTITQSGAGAVTLTGGAGAISLGNGNDFVGVVGISNSGANDVTINDVNGLTLGTLAIGQNMNVTSAGALNLGTGTIGGTLTANSNGGAVSETAGGLSVVNTTLIIAGAAAITLNDAGNDFQGAVSLSNSGAHNVALSNGSNVLALGAITVGSGTLDLSGVGITETGFISQSGAGAVTLSGGAGAISLGNSNDFVGVVGISNSGANDVTINDVNSLTLGTIAIGRNLTATSTGALNLRHRHRGRYARATTSNGGNITQSGALTITGTAGLNAGAGNINLNNTGNDFQGAVSVTAAAAVTLDDTNSLTLNGIAAAGAVAINFGQGGGTSTLSLSDTAITGTSLTISGGSASHDTLVGNDNGDTFTITGSNSGTISATGLPGTTTFSGVGSLTGGTGNDEFLFNGGTLAGSINGVSGTDTLAYTSGPISVNLQTHTATDIGGTFSNITNLIGSGNAGDTLIGANTTNAWTINAANGGSVGSFTFSAIANLTGGTGDDTFTISGGTLSGTITGGGFALNGDTIVGTGASAYFFDITASNAGSIGTSSGTPANVVHAFSGIQNLTGGNGDDTFAFSTASSALTGTIDGGGGTNTVDYTGSSVTSVTLGAALPGAGSITNIQDLIGSGAGFTLVADGTGDDFTISGGNSGNVDYAGLAKNLVFSNVGNLEGATGDTFDFTTGSLTGSLTGVGTNEILTYAGNAGPISVNLATGAATDITGGFSGITKLIGSGNAGDTLTGFATGPNTWTITGLDTGNVNVSFAFQGIANLVGGAAADNFVLSGGTIDGSIAGGGGTNSLTGNVAGEYFNISGANSGSLGTAAGTDTNLVTSYSGIQNLTDTGGGASFAFNGGSAGVVTGNGTDTLDYSGAAGAISITLSTNTSGSGTSLTSFSGIDALIGNGNAGDTLTGTNGGDAWSLSGTDSGKVNATFSYSAIANITGGTGNDTFTLAGGTVSGTLSGGGGNDTLAGNVAGEYFDITGANSGTLGTGTATRTNLVHVFTGIKSLSDTGGGASFAFDGGSLAGGITGNAGHTDILDYSQEGTAISVTLTGATAGTGSHIGTTFTGIDTLIGTGLGDTLTGANTTNAWTINAADGGSVGSFSFSAIANLTGGTGDDTFTISGGTLSGAITGGGFALNGDTIIGTGASAYFFDITGSNAGTIGTSSGTRTNVVHAFSGIQNLTGGNGDDTFAFSTASSAFTGTIDGGGGTNTVDYTGSSVTSVTLGAALPGAGSITNIQDLIGSGAGFTLVADGSGDDFTISGGNAG